MSITNYPFGFSDGVSLRGVPILNTYGGKVFWVSSTTGSDGNLGKTKEKPLATIDTAIGKCTASKGDIIMVLPGHVETLSTASAITCDVAGVSIVGLGNGDNKPKLTLSATAATIVVSADNVTWKNIQIVPGIADIVTVFSVSAAWCVLDGIFSRPNSTYSIKSMVTTTAAGDNLIIKNWDVMQTTAPGATSIFINLVGSDNSRIIDNTIYVTLANSATATVIGGGTTASLGLVIKNNNLVMVGGTTQLSVVLLYTGSTGLMTNNSLAATLTTLAGMNNPANCWCNENYCTKAVSKSGIIDPVVS
jgi:hypothetical protein